MASAALREGKEEYVFEDVCYKPKCAGFFLVFFPLFFFKYAGRLLLPHAHLFLSYVLE